MKMATDKETPCHNCTSDPNYAIICSFLDKFALKCGINHFNFLELQEMLENTVEVRQPLVDLHIKLLRKVRKSCSADKWERVLTKFCHSYSKQDGWELERFGYKNSRIEVKLRLLKHLLEAQFDSNTKFKTEVNKLSASELRIEPLGKDQDGLTYWCQFDPSCNIRIYKEDPDEEESWDLIAKDRVGLVSLIDELSSGEGQKELNSILNEDSNSLEIEKPITDTGQVETDTTPPELAGTTDESLSQDVIKQYSDSTGDTSVPDPSSVVAVKLAQTCGDSDSNTRNSAGIERTTDKHLSPPVDIDEETTNKIITIKRDVTNENKDASNDSKSDEDKTSQSHDKVATEKIPLNPYKKIENPIKDIIDKSPPASNECSTKGDAIDVTKECVKDVTDLSTSHSDKGVIDMSTLHSRKGPTDLSRVDGNKGVTDLSTSSCKESVTDLSTSSCKESVTDLSTSNDDNGATDLSSSNSNKGVTDLSTSNSNKCATNLSTSNGNKGADLSTSNGKESATDLTTSNGNNGATDLSSANKGVTDLSTPKGNKVVADKSASNENKSCINVFKDKVSMMEVKSERSFKDEHPSGMDEDNCNKMVDISKNVGNKEVSDKIIGAGKSAVGVNRDKPAVSALGALSVTKVVVKSTGDKNLNKIEKRGIGVVKGTLNKNESAAAVCVGEDLTKKIRIESNISTVQKDTIKNTSVTETVSKEEDSSVKSNSDQSSNSSEEEAFNRRKNDQKSAGDIMKNLSRMAGSKKPRGPPGSKLDEIFKFRRAHDPKTPTNLPPQSQPVPPYIGCNTKETILAQIKESVHGKEDSGMNLSGRGNRSEVEQAKSMEVEKFQTGDGLHRVEGRIGGNMSRQSLTFKNFAEKSRGESVGSFQAEDLSKPRPKVTEEKEIREPEPKKVRLDVEPKFSEAVEEPLMLVRGEGSGADCNTVNPRFAFRNFDLLQKTKIVHFEEPQFSEEVEEPIMFFFGEGSGAECDTGNPELEKKSNSDQKTMENDSLEENKSDDVNDESGQDRKVHKLWSIDNICSNKEKQNCEDTGNQFFFGPGCFKDMEKADDTSKTNSETMSNNNSPERTNCDGDDKCAKTNQSGSKSKQTESDNQSENNCNSKEKGNSKSKETETNVKSKQIKENNRDLKSEPDKDSEKIKENASKPETSDKASGGVNSNKEKKESPVESDVNATNTPCEPDESCRNSDNSSNGFETQDVVESEEEDIKKEKDEECHNSTNGVKDSLKTDVRSEDMSLDVKDEDKSEKEDDKADVKVEKSDETDVKHNKDKGKTVDENGGDKEPSAEDIAKGVDNDDKASKGKSKVGRNKKGKKEVKNIGDEPNEEEEEVKVEEIVEPRRSRRSAAVIAAQISESIIKPKGKKQAAKKVEEPSQPDVKDDSEIGDKQNKGKKVVQPVTKGGKKKKEAAKRGGSRKKTTLKKNPDQEEGGKEVDEEGKEVKQEDHESKEVKPVDADNKPATFNLNLFSFDVDETGTPPCLPSLKKQPALLSRKRRLTKTTTSDNDDEEEEEDNHDDDNDDDDEPLATKKQKLKSKKRKKKGGRPTKEVKEEFNSESEDDEAAEKREKPKKKPPQQKKPKEEENDPNKPKPKRGSKNLMGLTPRDLMDVDPLVGRGEDGGRSVRMSRRIALIKIKEQEEDRKLIEQSMQDISQDSETKKVKKKKGKETDEKKSKKKRVSKASDGDFTPNDQDSNDTLKKKKKGRPKKHKNDSCKYDINNPWKSSSGSGSSEDDCDELEHYDDEEEDEEDYLPKVAVSDHEFSPESDLEKEDSEGVPVRHARTALKGSPQQLGSTVDKEGEIEDDTPCEKCGKSDHPEWILLCDRCDSGWHGSCLRPALMIVPEGDWFCPPCQHLSLVDKLKETLRLFEKDSKRRENDELRRKRLAYVGISLSNVLPPPGTKMRLDDSSSSCAGVSESSNSSESSESSDDEDEPVYQLRVRRQANTSYRFNDYDQLINSAIQDEMEAVSYAGNQGRGKDIGNIVDAERDDNMNATNAEEAGDGANGIADKELDEEEEGGVGWRPHVVPRITSLPGKKKSRKLTNIDDVSSGDDKGSDEDFKGSASSAEDDDSGSEYSTGSDMGRGSKWRAAKQPVRRSTRARTSRIDKEFINDDSDESDAPKKKKSRKVWTESESSESDETWGRRKKKTGGGNRAPPRSKKKKKTKYSDDSESDVPKKSKSKKSKVRYGLSEDDDYGRKTRGRKMNYQESESDEKATPQVVKTRRVIESDEGDDYKPEPTDPTKSNHISDSDEDYSEEEDVRDCDGDRAKGVEDDKEVEDKSINDASKEVQEEVEKPEVKVVPPLIITREKDKNPEVKNNIGDDASVGDAEEDEEEEEEEMEEEEEEEFVEEEDVEEEEEPDEREHIKIPVVRNVGNKPVTQSVVKEIKPLPNLKPVREKILEEEFSDELSVPEPFPKIVPVPVRVVDVKEVAKEVESKVVDEVKVEIKKPEPPKVNTIRIVPQHKLMANPPQPQLDVKSMMMRPRVPGPPQQVQVGAAALGAAALGTAAFSMRYPRPPLGILRHPQYAEQAKGYVYPTPPPPPPQPSQYPGSPYYPPHHYPPAEEYPGYCPSPPVHPQQPSVHHPQQPYNPEEGEFGGLVSYFSSQHEDDLDS